MSESDQRLEIEAPEEAPADMPLPSDTKTFFVGGIFLLAMLATAYVAREIVLPLVFAVILNLLMQPTLRGLQRMRVPKPLGALLLILVLFATIVGLGTAVSGPAETWIAKLPEGIPRLQERLSFLNAPINALQTFLKAADNLASLARPEAPQGPWTAERFYRRYLRGRGASPAACSPPYCFSTSCLSRGTVSCGGSLSYCPGLKASGRPSISHSKSNAIFRPISPQLP